jgi:serine/threonine-protein kinase
MLTHDGLVKVLDVGIAKLADVTITRTTGAIGTLAYMRPEQAFAEPLDHRTDIWSLGVVLYEMLAGARPFRGDGEQAALVAALTAEPSPLGGVRDDVPPALESAVRRALAKRADDRFATVLEFAAEITAEATVRAERVLAAMPSPSATAGITHRDSTLSRAGERRQVIIVVSALTAYDALVERLEASAAERWLDALRAAADAIAVRDGRLLDQFTGDGVVLLFGVPVAREDDTVQGVRAAVELREALARLAATLEPRLAEVVQLRTGNATSAR